MLIAFPFHLAGVRGLRLRRRRVNSLLAALRPTHRDCVVALYAGANKRPCPRDLSPRPGRLNCLVVDFVAEDLFFNLVDSLLIHGI